MPKIEAKIKEITAMVSVLIAVALVFFGYFTLGVGSIDALLFFSVLIAIAPIAVLDYVDFKWRKSIDRHLPDHFSYFS